MRRMEEALAWARRARDLDPLGTSGHTIAWTLLNVASREQGYTRVPKCPGGKTGRQISPLAA